MDGSNHIEGDVVLSPVDADDELSQETEDHELQTNDNRKKDEDLRLTAVRHTERGAQQEVEHAAEDAEAEESGSREAQLLEWSPAEIGHKIKSKVEEILEPVARPPPGSGPVL
jgi:hypothetical protein